MKIEYAVVRRFQQHASWRSNQLWDGFASENDAAFEIIGQINADVSEDVLIAEGYSDPDSHYSIVCSLDVHDDSDDECFCETDYEDMIDDGYFELVNENCSQTSERSIRYVIFKAAEQD